MENAKGIAFPAAWSRSNSVLRSDGRRCNVLSNLLTTWTFTRRWDARIPPRVQETRCGCARAPRFPPMNIIRLVIFATHETRLPSPFLGDGDTRRFLLRPPRSFQFFQPRGKGWANNSWSGVRCARRNNNNNNSPNSEITLARFLQVLGDNESPVLFI